eukprot:TRINITY_DN27451_c0_g3_i1.p1 TRINITY_DN27451_c0_g3~~TRINITY_DN27451_c0_g3_i1.p1  ORF type:complete len:261 (-),score=73.36 TRINITY_DN27451_c0_g3_i1:31-813(-)
MQQMQQMQEMQRKGIQQSLIDNMQSPQFVPWDSAGNQAQAQQQHQHAPPPPAGQQSPNAMAGAPGGNSQSLQNKLIEHILKQTSSEHGPQGGVPQQPQQQQGMWQQQQQQQYPQQQMQAQPQFQPQYPQLLYQQPQNLVFKGVCRFWSQTGNCRKGDRCDFTHGPPPSFQHQMMPPQQQPLSVGPVQPPQLPRGPLAAGPVPAAPQAVPAFHAQPGGFQAPMQQQQQMQQQPGMDEADALSEQLQALANAQLTAAMTAAL